MREGNVMADEGFTDLAGRRVTLRRFHRDDLTTFLAYRSSEQVACFQSWDAPYPREEGHRRCRRGAERLPECRIRKAVVPKGAKAVRKIVGTAGFEPATP
jgi:RimJ/RimL family protein N-acetyltransferase